MGELHKNEVRKSGLWSEEHDRLPLKQRLKILLARSSFADLFPDFDSENDGTLNLPSAVNDGFVKEEDERRGSESSPSASFVREGKVGSWSYKQNYIGELGDCNDRVIEANTVSVDMIQAEKLSGMENSSLQQSFLPSRDVSINVQCADHSLSSSFRAPSNYSNGVDLQEIKIKNDIPVDFFDELDHVVLKERQRMLVSSQVLGLTKNSLEATMLHNAMKLAITFVYPPLALAIAGRRFQNFDSSGFPFYGAQKSNHILIFNQGSVLKCR